MRGGHYIAYVRGGPKIAGKDKDAEDYVWYYASDAYVREVSLEEVLRSEAYILFYEEIWHEFLRNFFDIKMLGVQLITLQVRILETNTYTQREGVEGRKVSCITTIIEY